MKKILFFVAIATALFGCVKSKDIYNGEDKQFSYTPSYMTVTVVTPPVGGTAVLSVGGKLVTVQCLTPTQSGDAIVLDAPIIPQTWSWDTYANEYKPSGFSYNSFAGFSSEYCKAYFVEILPTGLWIFRNGVSVNWDNTPNPASWVNAFEYPRTWIDRTNLPFRGRVTKTISQGVRYGISL